MTESRAGFSPAQLTVAVTLGAYAAGLSVLPARYLALGCLPLLAAALAWWTLARPGRWVAAFLSAALLLPPMPFAMGNSGPHPALIFAGLGLVAAAIAASSREIPLDGLTPALAALFLVLLGSVGFAALYSGPAIAVATLARVLLLAICLLMYFYNVRLHDRAISLRALYAVAVVSALMACVDFYYQFPAPTGFGAQFVWLASGVYRRAQGVFYEASTLGNLCAFFLVMIAVALSRPAREVPLPRRALFAGGVVFSAALLFSYSRASVLNVVVALVALSIFAAGPGTLAASRDVPIARGRGGSRRDLCGLPGIYKCVLATVLHLRHLLLHIHRGHSSGRVQGAGGSSRDS